MLLCYIVFVRLTNMARCSINVTGAGEAPQLRCNTLYDRRNESPYPNSRKVRDVSAVTTPQRGVYLMVVQAERDIQT